jgi:26S proteasome regulatory subunit N11
LELSKAYHKRLEDAEGKTAEELTVLHVGKIDPKRHLEQHVEELLTNNISQTLGLMLDTVIF